MMHEWEAEMRNKFVAIRHCCNTETQEHVIIRATALAHRLGVPEQKSWQGSPRHDVFWYDDLMELGRSIMNLHIIGFAPSAE